MSKLDKIEELQTLLKNDPQDFQLRRELAVQLIDFGFNEEALKHLLYLSKNFSNDEGIYYNLGIVYEKLKNFTKAKEMYRKALEIKPDYTDAIYNLGLVLTELKEYKDAIDCFNTVLEEDSNDSNTYFNLGMAYFKQKDYLNAIENVMLNQYYHSCVDEKSAKSALERVGLAHRLAHRPSELSGGEQQRLCIARALINEPDIIIADEPTGNLDEANEAVILELFKGLRAEGKSLILVTHNEELGKYADKIVRLRHGKLDKIEVLNEI